LKKLKKKSAGDFGEKYFPCRRYVVSVLITSKVAVKQGLFRLLGGGKTKKG